MSGASLAEFSYLESYTAYIDASPHGPRFTWNQGVIAMGPGRKDHYAGTTVYTQRYDQKQATTRVDGLGFSLNTLTDIAPFVECLVNPNLFLLVEPGDDPAKVEELRQWLLTNLTRFRPE